MARGDFGGLMITFKKVRKTPIGDIMGTKPMKPTQMMSKIWAFVKKNKKKMYKKPKNKKD